MVYEDGSEVMIDGILLPGLFKSIEVATAAEVEEQDVEGSTAKPKQATGYEDGKINLELTLLDSEGVTKEAKLQVIQDLFRKKGQDIPAVHSIMNKHVAQRNITQHQSAPPFPHRASNSSSACSTVSSSPRTG